MTQDAARKLTSARSNLLLDSPFFGSLALRMELVESDKTETMAVDANHMYYNADWVQSLSKHELIGVMAHNVMHKVYMHMIRRNERDQATWDDACDIVVNEALKNEGFVLPPGTRTDEGFTNNTAEDVYRQIYVDKPKDDQNQSGDGNGNGPSWGNVLDGGGKDGQTQAEMEQEVKAEVAAAAQAAKQAGKLPGNLEHLVEELLEPQMDWRELLWPFMTNLNEAEYSWKRPNRAYISEDEYFPSMHSEGLGQIVFAIDTSASMCNEEVQQCWSEIVDVCETCRPSEIIVIQADTRVVKVESFTYDEAANKEFQVKGRGGTRFTPTFEYVNEHYPDAECMVYLSDMECYDYPEAPDYPVMFISTRKNYEKPPFGEHAFMEKSVTGW